MTLLLFVLMQLSGLRGVRTANVKLGSSIESPQSTPTQNTDTTFLQCVDTVEGLPEGPHCMIVSCGNVVNGKCLNWWVGVISSPVASDPDPM